MVDLAQTENATKLVKAAAEQSPKVIPEQQVIEETVRKEMMATINKLIELRPDIGDFFVAGGTGDEKFLALREPVAIGERAGLVFLTPDGFKVLAGNTTDEGQRRTYRNQVLDPILANLKTMGLTSKFNEQGNEISVKDNHGSTFHTLKLENTSDAGIITQAMNSSIAKAQEQPRAKIAKGQNTIVAANAVQQTATRAVIK